MKKKVLYTHNTHIHIQIYAENIINNNDELQ